MSLLSKYCLENELESSTANLLEEKRLTAEVFFDIKENIDILEINN
jgi:hypothetical protein